LRLDWEEVHVMFCASAVEVAAVLQTRGWTGDPRPCSLSCRIGR
jgi:hypothetical protein